MLRWTSTGPFCAPVESFAPGPEPTDVAYFTTGGRLFRSRDGWSTWREAALFPDPSFTGLPFTLVAVSDPGRPEVVYGLRDRAPTRLFRSEDAGDTWQEIGELLGFSVNQLYVAPGDPAALFAVGLAREIFRSVDGGTAWHDVTPAGIQPSPLRLLSHPAAPRRMWLLTTEGVWRSDDQGAIWAPTSAGIDNASHFDALTVDPAAPDTAWVLAGDELFVTADGGGSWQLAGTLPLTLRNADVLAAGPEGDLFLGLKFGSDAGVWRSIDGGASWEEAGLSGEFIDELRWLDGPAVLAARSATGLYSSADRGASWQAVVDGVNASGALAVVYAGADRGTLLAGISCLDGRIARSDDRGRTWQLGPLLPGLRDIRVLAAAPSDPLVVLAAGNGEGVYRSTDGGGSWTYHRVGDGFPDSDFESLAIHPQDPDLVFGASPLLGLMRSLDGGVTWENVLETTGSLRPAVGIDPDDPRIVLFADGFRPLQRSTHGGATWHEVAGSPQGITHFVYDPDRPGFVLTGDNVRPDGRPDFSTDGGATWTRLDDGPPGEVRGLARDSTGIFWLSLYDDFFTAGAHLFRSDDGGLTWETAENGIPRDGTGTIPRFVNGFAASPDGDVAVATAAFGVFVLDRCLPGASTACLLDGRFRVEGSMRTFDDPPIEVATRVMELPSARAESDQAVFFESFAAGNFEAGVKMVDACGLPDGHSLRAFWVFFGGLTNAETEIDVEDTVTGQVYRWHNPSGELPLSLGDTGAFPCTDGVPATPCERGDGVACLLDGRFRVSGRMLSFDDPPQDFPARVMQFAAGRAESDQAVFFESFAAGNFEVGVKMVDACGLPAEHPLRGYWVFYGGLTNAATDVRVTRMDTGRTDRWRTSAGVFPRSEGRTTVFPCEE